MFEPPGNTEEAGKEPTILIVQDDESNREISLSLLGPETICKCSMRSTNQPNIYIRFLEEDEEPLSDEIRKSRLQNLSEVEILATHITSSSVHNMLPLDSSMGQVGLALCNVKRTQQLQVISSITDDSIHFGEASPGVLAKKAGGVVRLFRGNTRPTGA